MNEQTDEEVHRARYERIQSTEVSLLVEFGVHHPPSMWLCSCSPTWELSETHLLGFLDASFHKHDWLSHWPLVIDSTSSPLLSPEAGTWG